VSFRNPDGLDPTITTAIREALRQDRTVELCEGEWGMALAVDGDVLVEGLAWESFDYPLQRGEYTDAQCETLERLVEDHNERKKQRRKQRVAARDGVQSHTAAEGQPEVSSSD
jgi:hypothetical protein